MILLKRGAIDFMDSVDFILLVALAAADLLLLSYLRQRRRQQLLQDRIQHCLVLAIRQVNESELWEEHSGQRSSGRILTTS
jgi:hypothetical protein